MKAEPRMSLQSALRVNENFRALEKVLEISFGGWLYHNYRRAILDELTG